MSKEGEPSYTYTPITRADSELLDESWYHCVHVIIYADLPPNVYLFNRESNVIQRTAMMQMRFDGRLGFPGGFVDKEDSSLESALVRELTEEMGSLPPNFTITPADYLFSHKTDQKKYCLHFFGKQVDFDDFKFIEKRPDKEPFEGFEVLGAIRVPFYIFGPTRGGLPAFLKNNFIGNSKNQLLRAIQIRNLLPDSQLEAIINQSQIPDPLSTTSTV